MLFRLIPALTLLLAAAWAGAALTPRTGQAEVREASNGVPCFTISEREEQLGGAPDFQSVTVYDASARPRARMWTMSMPPARTFPLLSSMCIPYAGRVQSLPHSEAAMLESGKVYEVVIDVRAGHDATSGARRRGYSARFCLAKQRDGVMAVHAIGASAQEGRNLYGCSAPK